MHKNDQLAQDAGVTQTRTVDVLALIEKAVEAVRDHREVEVRTFVGDQEVSIRVKSY